MNKTSIVNIAGIIFNIEDDAYELLKEYNNAIRAHFINSSDGMEIVTDIESRIAELFSEILKTENRNAIIMEDVKYVIERLGKVSDFTFDGSEDDKTSEKPNTPKEPKRLVKSEDNKTIGGVCAGIADYLNVDPTWIRIAWLFLLCFYGMGFIVYILLWAILPSGETDIPVNKPKRRLYRDVDNKKISGVCAGFGTYFNIDPTWIRLIFVALLLLSFSILPFRHIKFSIFVSAGFSMLFVYFVLSLIIPEAKTVAEKMAMKGEPDNLDGIIRNVTNRTKDNDKKKQNNNFFDSIFSAIGSLFNFIVLVVLKFSGLFLFLSGIVGVITVVVLSVLALTYYDSIFNYDFISQGHRIAIVVSLLLNCAIIILAVLYLGAKMLWNAPAVSKLVTLSSVGIWITTVALLSYFAVINVKEVNKGVILEQKDSYVLLGDTLYIERHNDKTLEYKGYKGILKGEINFMDDNCYRNANIRYEKSPDDKIHIIQEMKARGKTSTDAASYAERVNYNFSVKDSLLSMDRNFTLNENTPVRFQRLRVRVQIPANTVIQPTGDLCYEYPFNGRNKYWKCTNEGLKRVK